MKRQRAQQHGVQDAEHGSACANAKSHDQYGKYGEAWLTPHGTRGVAEILHQALKKRKRAGVSLKFLGRLEPAKTNHRLPASFFGPHARLDVFFYREGKMSL
jgi:hypothetical protein